MYILPWNTPQRFMFVHPFNYAGKIWRFKSLTFFWTPIYCLRYLWKILKLKHVYIFNVLYSLLPISSSSRLSNTSTIELTCICHNFSNSLNDYGRNWMFEDYPIHPLIVPNPQNSKLNFLPKTSDVWSFVNCLKLKNVWWNRNSSTYEVECAGFYQFIFVHFITVHICTVRAATYLTHYDH